MTKIEHLEYLIPLAEQGDPMAIHDIIEMTKELLTKIK